jgi:thiosulfate/3-mercaptopyruvate sulfurtransferase
MNAPKAHSLPINPREDIIISADGLNARLGEENLCVLDTRSDAEWTGENTRGGPRGGTIPGAVHLEWTHYLDGEGKFKSAAELTAMFEGLGVTRDKAIVPF